MALLVLVCPPGTAAQPDKSGMTKEGYIARYRDDAVTDMLKTGVPASITLAQGILESEFGNSMLAREANNHFGIKCHSEWTGDRIFKDDDHRNECFRKYASVAESFEDHSRFLRSRDRYAFLFDLEITDYKGWAHGLKRAGYATNPHYADRLIRIIEENDLSKLDRMGTAMPVAGTHTAPPPGPSRKQRVRRPAHPPRPAGRPDDRSVPFVLASEGDTYYSLAVANDMAIWQVLKYNDADKYDIPGPGERIYLKPKKARAAEKVHIAEAGETMRGISQRYAVKLKKLYKYNRMKPGEEPSAGQSIRLR